VLPIELMMRTLRPSPAGGRGAGERVFVKTLETNFKHIGHQFEDILQNDGLAITLSRLRARGA